MWEGKEEGKKKKNGWVGINVEFQDLRVLLYGVTFIKKLSTFNFRLESLFEGSAPPNNAITSFIPYPFSRQVRSSIISRLMSLPLSENFPSPDKNSP